jgi:hypothetical protein
MTVTWEVDTSTLYDKAAEANTAFARLGTNPGVAAVLARGVWDDWTTTVTSAAGTITTVGATSARWRLEGSTVFWTLDVTITANGTGATAVNFTLPPDAPPAVLAYSGSGRENNVTGFQLQVYVNGTTGQIYTYANLYPGGTGYRLICAGFYEADV